MLAVDELLATQGNPHRFETFDNVHSWMPPELAAEAVAWLELVAMQRGSRPKDDPVIEERWSHDLEAARALEAHGDLLGALRRYEMMARTYDGLRDTAAAASSAHALSERREVKTARKEQQKLLAWETRMKGVFAQGYDRLRQAPVPMPAPKLRLELGVQGLLRTAEQDDAEGLVARRLLATLYTELSFYLTRELFSEHRWGHAASALTVATEISDNQPTAWYNLACALARSGHADEAMAALDRVVDLGWGDADLTAADPDLESLHGDEGFEALLDRMRGLAASASR
jgi:tetratricopeptide (TPR) repeat protein